MGPLLAQGDQLLLLNSWATSACFFHAGFDFKCPAGPLGYEAAPLAVPGTVTWGPGTCLWDKNEGPPRTTSHSLSIPKLPASSLPPEPAREGLVLAHFTDETTGAQGSRIQSRLLPLHLLKI